MRHLSAKLLNFWPEKPNRPNRRVQVRLSVKVLFTLFFYDYRGIVYQQFLPQGRTVNKKYYFEVISFAKSNTKKPPELWRKINGFCITIMHLLNQRYFERFCGQKQPHRCLTIFTRFGPLRLFAFLKTKEAYERMEIGTHLRDKDCCIAQYYVKKCLSEVLLALKRSLAQVYFENFG